jgi:hypothetical protein
MFLSLVDLASLEAFVFGEALVLETDQQQPRFLAMSH